MGHRGAASEQDFVRHLASLEELLSVASEIIRPAWRNYDLLMPNQARFAENVYNYQASKIMGTRTPFEIQNLNLSSPMEDGTLHLYNHGETRTLRLLPMIRIMPAPRTAQNACYFYNRVDAGGIRFLSYHYEEDSEVIEEFTDTAKAIDYLFPEEIGQRQ